MSRYVTFWLLERLTPLYAFAMKRLSRLDAAFWFAETQTSPCTSVGGEGSPA
jgi:hypothetical protein